MTQTPEEAEGFVWLGGPDGLAGVLHDGVRWVQLPSRRRVVDGEGT